ncbi:MAG: sulfite exporter TauE/SafE family protein [Planctomycetota bacterium]
MQPTSSAKSTTYTASSATIDRSDFQTTAGRFFTTGYCIAFGAAALIAAAEIKETGWAEFVRQWIIPPTSQKELWEFFALAGSALLITAISKGGFGGGVGILSVPLMIYATGSAKLVLGLWLPVLIVCDATTIHRYPKEWSMRAVLRLTPGMILGITIVTIFLGKTNLDHPVDAKRLDDCLKLIVAAVSIVFLVLQLRPARASQNIAWQPSWLVSLPVGTIAGVTTMIAHAAGPIVVMFLLPQKLPKRVFMGTCGRFFFIFNTIKVPFMLAAGAMTLVSLRYGVWLMLLGPLGVWLGAWLNRRISPLWFVRLVQVSLFITAIKLVYDVLK